MSAAARFTDTTGTPNPHTAGALLQVQLEEPVARLGRLVDAFDEDESDDYAYKALRQAALLRRRAEAFERLLIELSATKRALSNRLMAEITGYSPSKINGIVGHQMTDEEFRDGPFDTP